MVGADLAPHLAAPNVLSIPVPIFHMSFPVHLAKKIQRIPSASDGFQGRRSTCRDASSSSRKCAV